MFNKGKNKMPKKTNVKSKRTKETFPHFRFYEKSKHPAMILEEYSADEYQFRKVTHSEKEGRHSNEKIDPNPNSKDKKPMYIVKRERHDKKSNFSAWKYPWKFPKKKK